jgi:Cytosol aminopeptidase family, N-terminal domain
MTVTWAIELDTEPAERLRADLLVAPFFLGERPLRGAAGRIDWRLGGHLSAMLARGAFDGEAEQAVLVPTGSRLRAPRALLVGLGAREGFAPRTLRTAARQAVARAAALRAGTVALVLPAESEGGLPAERAAAAALIGAGEALQEHPFPLRLRLGVEAAAAGRARVALAELVPRIEMDGVMARLAAPEPERAPVGDDDLPPLRPDPRLRSSASPKLPSLP